MPTPQISRDLRERIVAHYEDAEAATYKSTAKVFRVGVATVNRILRAFRETGDVAVPARPKKPKFKVNLTWLERHAIEFPDARLRDRADAFKQETGKSVSLAAVFSALRALGFTHKKKRYSRKSATLRGSNKRA